MYRFESALKVNDKEAQAKITLFEKIEGKNRIYTLELEEIKPLSLSAGASNSTERAVQAQSMGDIAHEAPTIAKTDEEIIPQNPQKLAQKTEQKEFKGYKNELTGRVLGQMNEYLSKNEALNPQNLKLKSVDDFLEFMNGWRDDKKEPLSVKHLQDFNAFKDEIGFGINDNDFKQLAEKLFYALKGIDPKLEPLKEGGLMYQLKEARNLSDEAFMKRYLGGKYDSTKLQDYKKILNDFRQKLENELNISKVKEFGTNYAEFYKDGKGAIQKLLNEKQGQVSGAFFREDLGDITLPYGNDEIGLKKIYEKHLSDFAKFGEGESGLINGLSEIVEKGKLVSENKVHTIIYKKDDETYRVGISQGWHGEGNQKWIITSYKADKSPRPDALPSSEITKGDGTNLRPNDKDIIPQKSENEISYKEFVAFRKEIREGLKKIQSGLKSISQPGGTTTKKSKAVYWGQLTDKDIEWLKYKEYDKRLMDKYYAIKDDPNKKEEVKELIKDILRDKKHLEKLRAEQKAKNDLVKQKELEKEQKELDNFNKKEYIDYIKNLSKEEIHKEFDSLTGYFGDKKTGLEIWKQDILLQAKENIPAEFWDSFTQDRAKWSKFKNFKERSLKGYLEYTEKEKIYRQELESFLNISPIKEFGTNYAEFYKDGKGAIQKLLNEKQGQVSGAFYREDLKELSDVGDIDLVWGEALADQKGFGLAHILDKHEKEFTNIAEELSEIVENGKLVDNNGAKTIWLKKDDKIYKLGLGQGFKGEGQNHWVLTAYEATREKDKTFGDALFTDKQPLSNLDKGIIPQKEQNPQNLPKNEALKSEVPKEQVKPNEPSLKERLERASDEEKKAILIEELEKKIEILDKRYKELIKEINETEFSEFEIKQKMQEFYNIGDEEVAKIELRNDFMRDVINPLARQINNVLKIKEVLTNDKYKAYRPEYIKKAEKLLLKEESDKIKERNITYDLNTSEGEAAARKLFESAKPDEEQRELFERVLPVAQKLGVEFKHAINKETLSKKASGVYYFNQNSARVKNNRTDLGSKGIVLLHELIHSVSSRALYAYENGKKELLSANQIRAIENIESLFKEVSEDLENLGFEKWYESSRRRSGDYGTKNTHEFLAELSDPVFREKLKKVGVFEAIIDNILRLFLKAKDLFNAKKTNAYESLKKSLYEIMDHYDENFTQKYNESLVTKRDIGVNTQAAEATASQTASSEIIQENKINYNYLKNIAKKYEKYK